MENENNFDFLTEDQEEVIGNNNKLSELEMEEILEMENNSWEDDQYENGRENHEFYF